MPCHRCLGFLATLLKSSSSTSPQIDLSVGLEASRYPKRTERLRKASRRALSSAFAKPHQAGEAYDSLVMTVAWKTQARLQKSAGCYISSEL
jgi:hypothetical protein